MPGNSDSQGALIGMDAPQVKDTAKSSPRSVTTPQKSLESAIAASLSALQPDSDTIHLTNEELLETYVTLFDRLMTKHAVADLQKALYSQDAYSKFHRCAIRDAKRALREKSPVCDIAVKVLAWIWFRSNGMGRTEKEEAVDTLMEIFFTCEQSGSKSLSSTAQMCVWALSSVGGRFPTESGRYRRALEVAQAANHNNVFNSERIQCESSRLLKSLAVNNPDSLAMFIDDWIVPVVLSLCHPRSDKIRDISLDALMAGIPVIFERTSEVERGLNRRPETWAIVSEYLLAVGKEHAGSSKRIHLSKCFGILFLVFGSTMRADLDRINVLFGLTETFLLSASGERLNTLKQWRFVIEALAMDGPITRAARKLQSPMRTILKEGKEPDAQVRREAFVTWSFLASMVLPTVCDIGSEENRAMVRDLFKTLTRALGDYDTRVRGPAVQYAVEIVRLAQMPQRQCRQGTEDQDKQRRSRLLESTVSLLTIPLQTMKGSAVFPELADLCLLLDATFKAYPDLDEHKTMELFLETRPLWIAQLTTESPTASPLAISLAERTLGSMQTLRISYAEQVLLWLGEVLDHNHQTQEEGELRIISSPHAVVDAIIDCRINSEKGADENPNATVFEILLRLLAEGGAHDLARRFWTLKRPVQTWIVFSQWMCKCDIVVIRTGFDVSLWLAFVFRDPESWTAVATTDEFEQHIVGLFSSLLLKFPETRHALVGELTQDDVTKVRVFSQVSAKCLGILFSSLSADSSELITLSKVLGKHMAATEKNGGPTSIQAKQVQNILVEACGRAIQQCCASNLPRLLMALLVPPCNCLMSKLFASIIYSRMMHDFTWDRYEFVFDLALKSTDRAVRSLATSVVEDYATPHEVPPALIQLIRGIKPNSLVAPQSGTKPFLSPRITVSSAGPSSSAKKARILESSDRDERRGAIGVATYTNLDPSQGVHQDEVDQPLSSSASSIIAVQSLKTKPYSSLKMTNDIPIVGSTQEPSHGLVNELRNLAEHIRSTDVKGFTPEDLQALKEASTDLVRELFDVIARRS